MNQPPNIPATLGRWEIVDNDAIEIGQLYQKSGHSLVDSVKFSIECGLRLTEKKATMKHGQWKIWLADNAGGLGFSNPRTAQKLMKVAKAPSTAHLDIPEIPIEVAAKATHGSYLELATIEINTDSEPLYSADSAAKGALAHHMGPAAKDASTHHLDPAASTEYTGGIVPEAMRLEIRDAYQTAGITQAQAAELLGLSRPHLANALAGRYSLSKGKAVQLRAFLAQPPPIVAPRLL